MQLIVVGHQALDECLLWIQKRHCEAVASGKYLLAEAIVHYHVSCFFSTGEMSN